MSRYYNPEIARFISEDTYRGDSNDPLSLNRYVYVNNNPLIYDDPNGHFLKKIMDGAKFVGKKIGGLAQAAGEVAVDTAVGVFNLGWTAEENTLVQA